MDRVREIIVECQEAIKTPPNNTPYFINVVENIDRQLKLFSIIENNFDILQDAKEEYIKQSKTPSATFLRDWLEYGIKIITTYFDKALTCNEYPNTLPPDVKEQWPLFFEETNCTYEISFYKTKERIDRVLSEGNIKNCTDEEILAIHKDKDCDCPYICSICHTMETQWYKKVKSYYISQNNIFINTSLHSEFIQSWILENPTYNTFKFPPTKLYFIDISYREKDRYITDFAEAYSKIKKDREIYNVQGKTPKQCYDDLCNTISYYVSQIKKSDSDFSIFMFLWNKLDIIPIIIEEDKKRCLEIKEMLYF
jgi:hypothetical protein